jgi:magnesium chelatase subunit D
MSDAASRLPHDITDPVVGRRRELRLLLSALERGKAVLLVGLPGVSKTTMVRALAHHLGDEPDRFVDVTGDEQLTAHALVGTFDPPMVLKDGYQPEHFVPGPLARAMQAGGILYLEEMNRAPAGALNVLMTALSERYLEVPRLGRIEARAGFTVIGAANPLDDVGTTRLSRGLVDRFVTLELDYQARPEELAIVRRRCGVARDGFHAFAVDVGRESRTHPDLRHGSSIRGAIDFTDLLSAWDPGEIDLETLRFVGCSAYAGKLRVKPSAGRSACEIVHELIDAVLRRDHGASVDALLEHALAAPTGEPVPADGDAEATLAEEGEAALGGGGERPATKPGDEIPGLSRPGASGEPGESRSVPMVGRDRPSSGGTRATELDATRDEHLRDPELVLRHARELVLRVREGMLSPAGAQVGPLDAEPWIASAPGPLAVEQTLEAYIANGGRLAREDFRVEARARQRRDYVILVDHSGSMVGRKLELAATLAAALAQLSAAGRADYAVIAFDEQLSELKSLGLEADVEDVIDRVLRLPEGRATDLGKVLESAAAATDRLPDATDVVLISDCMPTRGVKSFAGLARIAARIPSLYICFADDRGAAIELFGGEQRLDLYQWWAQQWVGPGRMREFADLGDVEGVVDLLSEGGTE